MDIFRGVSGVFRGFSGVCSHHSNYQYDNIIFNLELSNNNNTISLNCFTIYSDVFFRVRIYT